jgi:hypothetical protein
MPPPTPAAPYRAWLLRCWHERGAAGPGGGWRFSLEEPGTGVRRGFASLAALLAFLEAQTTSRSDAGTTEVETNEVRTAED